jgi:hypothetical protein
MEAVMQRILSILALAVILPTTAMAQHPQTRQGFGISFGIGAGSAGPSCDGCTQPSGTEPSGYLRLGGYVTPALFVGGETNGWATATIFGSSASIGALMGVVQWYPAATTGMYLKGGLGYSYVNVYDAAELTASGFGVSIGAGYDWRVARNFALTPYINYLQQFGGSYRYGSGGGAAGIDANVHLFQFGLGFTWF